MVDIKAWLGVNEISPDPIFFRSFLFFFFFFFFEKVSSHREHTLSVYWGACRYNSPETDANQTEYSGSH